MTGRLIVSGLGVLAAACVAVAVRDRRDVRRIRAMEGEWLAQAWEHDGAILRAERGSIADDISTSRTEVTE